MSTIEDTALFSEVFVYGDQPGISLRVLAETAGKAYQTVHGLVSDDRRHKPVWLWRAAFEVSGDHRFKRELEPRGWELVRRGRAVPSSRCLEREATDPILEASRQVELLRRASQDGHLSIRELAQLRAGAQSVVDQVREYQALLDKVEAAGGKVAPLQAVPGQGAD